MEKNVISQISNNFVMSNITFDNVFEKRVVYALIDSVSPYLKTNVESLNELKKLGKETSYQQGLFDIDLITYKAKDLESNRSEYPILRQALLDLDRRIVIETEEETIATRFVPKFKWNKRSDLIEIQVDRELIQFLCDITGGYANAQIKTAISLKSHHSMKIYELLCSWRNKPKFNIKIEKLRFITGCLGIYSNAGEFKRRVLDVAMKELNNHADTDLKFKYKVKKEGVKVVSYDFYIIKTNKAYEEKKKQDEVSPRWSLSKELIDSLEKQNILVKGQTIETIKKWSSEVYNHNDNDMIHQIGKYVEAAERKFGEGKNYAAYIMNCIKKDIK